MSKIKNKKNGLPANLFLLFAVLIVAVVFYVSWIFDVKKQGVDIAADIPKKNEQEMKSDMVGWDVFSSIDRGFRIDYPQEWKVQVTKLEDLSTHSVYFGEPVDGYFPVMVNFYNKPSDISLEDWVEKNAYFSGTFERGFVESNGLLPNFYIDETVVGGAQAFEAVLLSDTYFIPRIFKGKLDNYYSRCKCDYDAESVYVTSGGMIIGITLTNNMNGKETANELAEENGRYVIESSDEGYLKNKKIFSSMINSFRFMDGGK